MMAWDVMVQMGIAAALAAMVMFGLRLGNSGRSAQMPRGSIAFLFEAKRLVDATRPARDMLAADNGRAADLDRLIDLLSPRFPFLRKALEGIEESGEIQIAAIDGERGVVRAHAWDGLLRITLTGDDSETAAAISNLLAEKRMREEVCALRTMADDSPHLMWREDRDGTIQWANRTFLDLVDTCHPQAENCWPPRGIFSDLPRFREEGKPVTSRHPILPDGTDTPRWFEITSQWNNGQNLHVAAEITEEVRAKDLQRDLMQTVTKTFAGLSVGLAVFDRNRQLVLFNPALSDLTGLKPARLVSRPQVETFLNMMREQRTVPDKKDFSVWRHQFISLEQGRSDTVENWDLPDGRRFRVTGRPFPNGAVALLIEDVSSDVALTRRLNEALSLGQEVLDNIGDAVTVFSHERYLLLENAPSVALWGAAQGKNLIETLNGWRAQCRPSPGWEALMSHVLTGRIEAGQTFSLTRQDDSRVELTLRPTFGGGIALTSRVLARHAHRNAPASESRTAALARQHQAALSAR